MCADGVLCTPPVDCWEIAFPASENLPSGMRKITVHSMMEGPNSLALLQNSIGPIRVAFCRHEKALLAQARGVLLVLVFALHREELKVQERPLFLS